MIKKLNPSDQNEFSLWAEKIPQTPQFNWVKKGLLNSLSKYSCWGYWHQNELVSVICMMTQVDPWEILWLATQPDQLGQGFMKKLLQQLINDAKSQNSDPVTSLMLEVHEKNLPAIKLYASLGFIETGRRKNYYIDGASGLVMTLKLQ